MTNPEKPIIKQSELDQFNDWKAQLNKNYLWAYENGLKQIFGERAYQVKTKLELADLANQLSYFSSLCTGQFVIEDDYYPKNQDK